MDAAPESGQVVASGRAYAFTRALLSRRRPYLGGPLPEATQGPPADQVVLVREGVADRAVRGQESLRRGPRLNLCILRSRRRIGR